MQNTTLKNWFFLPVVMSALLLAALGCGLAERLRSGRNAEPTMPTISPKNTDPTNRTASSEKLYESQAQINEFLSALTSAVGNDNPNVLDVKLYDSYAMVQVQDPAKPENIDGYTWRDGKLSEPAPVKIIGGGKIEDNVFPLKDVNFAGLPDLTKEILEKLKDVEGGKLIGYVVKRNLPFSKDIEISPLANGTRKSVYVDADKNAKLKKFEVK